MHALDPGFRPDHVLVAYFQLPAKQYPTHASSDAFDRDIVERLSSKPGIVAVGITWYLPELGSSKSAYTIESEPVDRWKLKFAGFAVTYGDYFRAIGIPLIEGRYFTPDDRSDSLPVMIVNQSLARHAWPGQSAIGKRMHAGNPKKALPWATVVGVVADTKLGAPDEPSIEQWYAPMQQPAILYGAEASKDLGGGGGGFITLRSALPPEQMIHVLRSTVAELDPLLPLQQVQAMDDVISNVEAPRRFNTTLITTFAVGALLLALTGIYAVVAFSASLRTHEIAVRMALGAQRTRIAALILSSALKLALLGCTFGVLGSLAVSRIIKSLLFDVSATDPFIYLAAVLIMMAAAVLASALPASRVACVDPILSLRSM
jgi:putative ABC transport system permease protein